MEIIDAGHVYKPEIYDGYNTETVVFMKREGVDYPGNIGHYAGTNCQELLRILIDRIKYLQNQIPCWQNSLSVKLLRIVIWLFEIRAAWIHNKKSFVLAEIELEPTCKICGHIFCEDKHYNE